MVCNIKRQKQVYTGTYLVLYLLGAKNKNPHASLLESTTLKETKEFWGTRVAHRQRRLMDELTFHVALILLRERERERERERKREKIR